MYILYTFHHVWTIGMKKSLWSSDHSASQVSGLRPCFSSCRFPMAGGTVPLMAEILHQLTGNLTHSLQGFIHPNGWPWDFFHQRCGLRFLWRDTPSHPQNSTPDYLEVTIVEAGVWVGASHDLTLLPWKEMFEIFQGHVRFRFQSLFISLSIYLEPKWGPLFWWLVGPCFGRFSFWLQKNRRNTQLHSFATVFRPWWRMVCAATAGVASRASEGWDGSISSGGFLQRVVRI